MNDEWGWVTKLSKHDKMKLLEALAADLGIVVKIDAAAERERRYRKAAADWRKAVRRQRRQQLVSSGGRADDRDRSVSLRTCSGGLPTLGKRR